MMVKLIISHFFVNSIIIDRHFLDPHCHSYFFLHDTLLSQYYSNPCLSQCSPFISWHQKTKSDPLSIKRVTFITKAQQVQFVLLILPLFGSSRAEPSKGEAFESRMTSDFLLSLYLEWGKSVDRTSPGCFLPLLYIASWAYEKSDPFSWGKDHFFAISCY